MKTRNRALHAASDLFSTLDDLEAGDIESMEAIVGLSRPTSQPIDPRLPPIILVHGITDCHLKNLLDDGNRVWLDYVDLVRGRFSRQLTLQSDGKSDREGTRFETDGPLWRKYRTAIQTWQENGFDASVFCYDWRRSVVDASQQLHQYLVSRDAVKKGKKSVLVCHSMGGVVASYWAATQPDWEKYVERCVFVGSPLAGAYSAAQAILGLSPSFRKMALLSITESMEDFQRMAASFPGLVDLLPNPDVFPEAADLYERDGWPGDFFPRPKLLEQSRSVKRVVWNSPLFHKSVHLISSGLPTLAEMPWDAARQFRTDDVLSSDGDGSVLNKSSTPEGLKAYLVSGEHSMLLNVPEVINAVQVVARGGKVTLPEYGENLSTGLRAQAIPAEIVVLAAPANIDEKIRIAIEQYASDDMKRAMLGIRTHSVSHSFSKADLLSSSFSWQNCFSLALASQLAYQKDVDEIDSAATLEWKFPFARSFDQRDTQGLVLADDHLVVLAFRGSEANLGDWLGNFNVAATNTPIGRIHRGFWNAYQDAESAFQRLLNECHSQGKALWICGHSLGGALAVIAGAMLCETQNISGVYTYGQPKVCVNTLDSIYQSKLPNRYVRVVNDKDVVAQVPPGYSHFGQLKWFAGDGALHLRNTGDLPEGLALPLWGHMELNQREFDDLQEQLRRTTAADSSMPTGLSTTMRLPEGAWIGISFSDHSLAEGYIPAIEKQF